MSVRAAIDLLSAASDAVVLTGAGVSTASGLPDFRSSEGLWQGINPMTVATATVLRDDPARFWAFYRQRFMSLRGVQPNPVHHAITELQRIGIVSHVTTQNIDGLHRAAGTENVAEVHGQIGALRCNACAARYDEHDLDTLWSSTADVPVCAACDRPGNVVRPGTVLFEEMLPEAELQLAYDHAARCDLMLVLGTSLEVHPVAALPGIVLDRGRPVVLITQGETPYDDEVTVRLRGDLVETMTEVMAGVRLARQ